jgi:hypothetical protein
MMLPLMAFFMLVDLVAQVRHPLRSAPLAAADG